MCLESVGMMSESEKIKGVVIPKTKPSLVGWVFEHKRMTVADAGRDERHLKEIETDFQTKSSTILSFPLMLESGDVYGAVQLIDTTSAEKMNLDRAYLEFLTDLVDACSIALSNSMAFNRLLSKAQKLEKAVAVAPDGFVTGVSKSFQEVMRLVHSYASTDYPVLIFGESGTGKEHVARKLHELSARKDNPFQAINCGAIPHTLLESELFGYKKGAFTGAAKDKPGMFESADKGTLFLDEVGEMDIGFQPKLLRVLQDNMVQPLGSTVSKKVDVRIVAATNKDIPKAIGDGGFREDLYYRLNVLPISLPPLRERPEDVPVFLEFFMAREAAAMGRRQKRFTPAAMTSLCRYPWPGNVRELENFIKQVIVMVPGDNIDTSDIPAHLLGGAALSRTPHPVQAQATGDNGQNPEDAAEGILDMNGLTWAEVEQHYARHLLEKYRWNISHAANMAGVNRSTFNSRLKKLGISKKEAY